MSDLEGGPMNIDNIISPFIDNVIRLADLIEIFVNLQSEGGRRKDQADEILRSVVVLSHASLEDAVREFVRQRMKEECRAEVLDDIPLAGVSPTNRRQKFLLGELSKYRGKTVDELIEESIDEYLDRTSFSSSRDIAGFLERSGVDLCGLRAHFATLDEMISRRHQIVHKADREGDPGNGGVAPIDKSDVIRWVATVSRFVFHLYLEATGVIETFPEGETFRSQLEEYMERLERCALEPIRRSSER